jgi:hypothetical protein
MWINKPLKKPSPDRLQLKCTGFSLSTQESELAFTLKVKGKKKWKEAIVTYLKGPFWHLPGRTAEDHGNPSYDSRMRLPWFKSGTFWIEVRTLPFKPARSVTYCAEVLIFECKRRSNRPLLTAAATQGALLSRFYCGERIKRTEWMGSAAFMGEERHTGWRKIDQLDDTGIHRHAWDNIKMGLEEIRSNVWTRFIWLSTGISGVILWAWKLTLVLKKAGNTEASEQLCLWSTLLHAVSESAWRTVSFRPFWKSSNMNLNNIRTVNTRAHTFVLEHRLGHNLRHEWQSSLTKMARQRPHNFHCYWSKEEKRPSQT